MSDPAVRIDRVRVGITNTYLLQGRGAVLIDPGEPGRASRVLAGLRAHGGALPRIGLIVVSHGHFDHVGCGAELREATGAPIAVHHADAGWMERGVLAIPAGLSRWGRCLAAAARLLLPRLVGIRAVVPDVLLDDELSLDGYGIPGGRVVHTPGHTPGSVSVLLPSGDAIVGDLAMNALPFCLRPSLAIAGDDIETMRESWHRLLERGARRIHPGHGGPFPAAAIAGPQPSRSASAGSAPAARREGR